MLLNPLSVSSAKGWFITPIIGLPDSISYPPMRHVTQPNPDVGIPFSRFGLLLVVEPRMYSSVASRYMAGTKLHWIIKTANNGYCRAYQSDRSKCPCYCSSNHPVVLVSNPYLCRQFCALLQLVILRPNCHRLKPSINRLMCPIDHRIPRYQLFLLVNL